MLTFTPADEMLWTLLAVGMTVLCLAISATFARYVMKRALWAPRFSLIIWGYVVVMGVAGMCVADPAAIPVIVGSWSMFIIPLLMTPLFFFFSLSLFNVDVARPPIPDTRIFNGRWIWTITTAVLPDGRRVVVDRTWMGWYHRARGLYTVVQP